MAKKNEVPDNLSELKAALKEKNPGTFYVFHGEESYLKTHYLEQLRKLILDGPADEFNYHRFNNETMNPDRFQDAVDALPMMAERSLILVEDYDPFRANEADRERMTAVLSDLPDYCCVVFYYETVEYKADGRLKKLAAAMSRALVVDFRKQQGKELIVWIRRHFMRQKKDIDDRLCQYLVFITGGTMTALASEIEKICAYTDHDMIQKTDIDAVVEPVLDAQVWDITDAICAGEYTTALEKLQTMIKMQEEPIPILAAIGNQLRWLRAAKLLSAHNQGIDALKRICSIRADYPARKTMSAAARVSQEFCDKAVILCTETDYQMKTSYDDPERLLELLILRLAEEARHG